MQLTPLIALHMGCAIAATAVGPIALWARRGGTAPRPSLHRAAGYAFTLLMLGAAISAIFIRDWRLPNWHGYTLIHLLVPLTFASLAGAFVALAQRRIARHSKIMRSLYLGACVTAGLFTLLPGRSLGNLLWSGLGLI